MLTFILLLIAAFITWPLFFGAFIAVGMEAHKQANCEHDLTLAEMVSTRRYARQCGLCKKLV